MDPQPPSPFSCCQYALTHPIHQAYHDAEYGFPIRGDSALLERLALESGQAGYGEEDAARLLADAGIVRNRLKVKAIIENARRLVVIRESHGSFASRLDARHPLPPEEWQKLFKKTFIFTGGEIVRSFLLGTGCLPGAHDAECPVYQKIVLLRPPWMSTPP